MCLHLTAGWFSAIGAAKSTASSGASTLDVVSSFVGGSALVAFLTWLIDRIRTRPRFGVEASIDAYKTVLVAMVKKGEKEGYPQAIKVVVVKPRLYRYLRAVKDRQEVSPVEVATLEVPDQLASGQTFQTRKTISEKLVLPPLLNPFGRFTEREWKRWELRGEVTIGLKRKYIRFKRKGGRFTAS
jgi:hypothetical protein